MYFVPSKYKINKFNVRNIKGLEKKMIYVRKSWGKNKDTLKKMSIILHSTRNKRVDCQLCLISQRSHTRLGS